MKNFTSPTLHLSHSNRNVKRQKLKEAISFSPVNLQTILQKKLQLKILQANKITKKE